MARFHPEATVVGDSNKEVIFYERVHVHMSECKNKQISETDLIVLR